MIINSQRTIYGRDLQLSMLCGKPYYVFPNTTLNEKFKVKTEEVLEEGKYPVLKYFAIGVGGDDMLDGNTGFNYSTHNPHDGALFQHIPFVMRTLDNDLTPTEKIKYRFRKIEIINNVEYACYYLKVIPPVSYLDSFYKVTVSDNEGKLSLFNTDTTDILNPTPVNKTDTIATKDDVNYVTKVVQVEFGLTEDELNDLRDVLEIRFPGENKKITELALCTGLDKEYLDEDITEALFVQVAFFITVDLDLSVNLSTQKDFFRKIEIGGSEPLLVK